MSLFDKNNPFLASIKSRHSLTKPGSQKNTHHIVLDLKGSGISYKVGESIGIYSQHDHELVSKTLNAIKATGKESIILNNGFSCLLEEYIRSKANLSTIPLKLLKEVFNRQSCQEKRSRLEDLLKPENHSQLKDYIGQFELWDFLLEYEEVTFSPQELIGLLMPLLPRFYSIASSQSCVGDEVHLTVAHVEYESRGYKRRGICTHYLCYEAPLNEPVVPIFLQPSHNFFLPDSHEKELIMVGPGTGIAPFRGFMQERVYKSASGKHWLFFGEQSRKHDFFYEEEWKTWESAGHLRVDTAFSRDQDHKVYVQHRMLEHGDEFYRWLERGAYFYVCGDAEKMAKDVDAALHEIVKEHGKVDEKLAREYVKNLRKQKRYLRDVY